MRRRIGLIVGLALVLGTLYLLTTDNIRVWPYRNTLQYYAMQRLGMLPPPADAPRGNLRGVVRSLDGQPIVDATVLVSQADGTAFWAETDATGQYLIQDVPAGRYVPVAGAAGYEDSAIRGVFVSAVRADHTTDLDITLAPQQPRRITPAANVQLSDPDVWYTQKPLVAQAVRRELRFTADGLPNQTTLFYTPDDNQTTPLPTLIAVYPGPADTWETVSIPLAQAGFAVIAVGPAYQLDLENDIDDLERVLQLVHDGRLPRTDPDRIGALGGSYSGLHVLRLAIRDPQAIDVAVLLGPPTDAFELRRQFEAGTFAPPFGLDQALIALGLPDRSPERYWRYSVRFHARSLDLPLMLIHSKEDEVVPFTQSEVLSEALDQLNKPHELLILEGLGHYFFADANAQAVEDLQRTTTEFLNRELR